MGKIDQWQQGRNEGLDFALRIVEKDGIDGLREEIKKRGITGISINLSHKELEQATENMRNMMYDTMLCYSVGILHDVFGFGPDRAQRYIDKFNDGTELLCSGVISWEQIIENSKKILGKDFSIRYNEKDTKLQRKY